MMTFYTDIVKIQIRIEIYSFIQTLNLFVAQTSLYAASYA